MTYRGFNSFCHFFASRELGVDVKRPMWGLGKGLPALFSCHALLHRSQFGRYRVYPIFFFPVHRSLLAADMLTSIAFHFVVLIVPGGGQVDQGWWSKGY